MMAERRQNRALTAVIEQIVELDRTRGCAAAWAYGAKWGIPASTLTRVLSLGGSRRISDSGSAADAPPFALIDIVRLDEQTDTHGCTVPGSA